MRDTLSFEEDRASRDLSRVSREDQGDFDL